MNSRYRNRSSNLKKTKAIISPNFPIRAKNPAYKPYTLPNTLTNINSIEQMTSFDDENNTAINKLEPRILGVNPCSRFFWLLLMYLSRQTNRSYLAARTDFLCTNIYNFFVQIKHRTKLINFLEKPAHSANAYWLLM